MARRYPDFFRDLEDYLDRSKTREDNLERLNSAYDRVRNQSSDEAKLEQALLKQAQKVFSNDIRYDEYKRQASTAEEGGAARYGKELEQTRRQARDAEAATRREAERRKELERQLQEERSRAEEAERQTQLQTEKPSLGFWYTVLKGAAEVGVEVLKERQKGKTQATSRPITQAYTPEQIDLSGDWGSSDGIPHRIWQRGNQIRVQAFNPFGVVVMDGTGTFDGRYLHASYQTAPAPTIFGFMATSGEARCEVSNNGRSIRGQARNHTTGQIIPINLYR